MKEKIKKIDSYIKAYGIRKTVGLLYEKATHKDQKDYERWLERHKITETIREAQKETVFNKQPCFSIVVPLYKTASGIYQRSNIFKLGTLSVGWKWAGFPAERGFERIGI